MDEPEGTLSIALCSGTDDKLTAAALLAVGAVATGRKVDVLLQYWALEAFRAGHLTKDHGYAPEASAEGVEGIGRLLAAGRAEHWSRTLAQAKELGEVRIHACSLSMDAFGLTRDDLDPLVDDVEGVTAFMLEATGAPVFI